MIEIKDMLLTNHNRPGEKIIKLKGIVIHWTANTNKGANALANRNYFNTTDRNASAHYIIDDKNIIRCIPEEEVAYHVGATNYTTIGESIQEKINGTRWNPNYFLIGIEMCVNSDADWNKTYQNTIELAAYLLNKYNLSIDDIYRHYDITGKDCPKMMLAEKEWERFKNNVKTHMKIDEVSPWARDAWNWVKEKGISDGTRPKDLITREEVWTMLYRMRG